MENAEYIKMGELEKKHWYFAAKRKFIDLAIKKYVKSGEPVKILDVGCGTGAVLEQMASNNFLVSGIDMNDTALEYCRQKGFSVEKGFADRMPYSAETFDIVFALDVLEHLDNPELAVKEVRRVLKPGGLFIVTVPAHQWLWSYHDESLHHKKRYNKSDLNALLSADLNVLQNSWIHGFILLPAIILRLLKNILGNKNAGSDVKESSVFVNYAMSLVYFVELKVFKLLGTLPLGLSLLAVAKKENQS
ncbi:MAG: class I SAM-dependent methyltransferase [Candidatus Magasanikbacteria bacterium]|nr:class I SAM-dependent methyltransferase [Candidatus Magasanikbacteria bacterium]